ncbi:MAG: hypothetical protein ABIH23_27670 [bacterium]
MDDPSDLTLNDLERLQAQGRILFIRRELAKTPEIFGRNLLLRGLSILGGAFTSECQRLSSQQFRACLYYERRPDEVTQPEDMVLFQIEDLGEQRYVIALAPVEEEEE